MRTKLSSHRPTFPVGLLRGHHYLLLVDTRLDVTRLVLS